MSARVTALLLAMTLGLGWAIEARGQVATPDATLAMRQIIPRVDLREVPAHRGFNWLSHAGRFNLLMSWEHLERAGYDRQTPVTLALDNVPVKTALALLTAEAFAQRDVMIQVNPTYVRIMTKDQANAAPVMRIYDVADLLHEAPMFDDAPKMDLNEIAGDARAGGGNSIWRRETDQPERLTRTERAERLADVIRNSIEPQLWYKHGGNVASISYYSGQLVVRAPEYIQRQIGLPTASFNRTQSTGYAPTRRDGSSPSATYRAAYRPGPRDHAYPRPHPSRLSNGVSGVDWRK